MLFQREPLLKASQVHARFHAALPDYTQQPTSKAEEIEAYIYNIYTYTYIFLYILGMVCICIQPISIWFEQCAAATRICGFAMLCHALPVQSTEQYTTYLCVQPRIST